MHKVTDTKVACRSHKSLSESCEITSLLSNVSGCDVFGSAEWSKVPLWSKRGKYNDRSDQFEFVWKKVKLSNDWGITERFDVVIALANFQHRRTNLLPCNLETKTLLEHMCTTRPQHLISANNVPAMSSLSNWSDAQSESVSGVVTASAISLDIGSIKSWR